MDARIFQEGQDFWIISLQTGEKKLAFTSHLRGDDLRRAILNEEVQIYLSGWYPEEVVEDLEKGGILYTEAADIAEISQPEFFLIGEEKGSVTWAHKSGLAKTFFTRQMERTADSLGDEDSWRMGDRPSGGYFTGRVEYFSFDETAAEADYNANPTTWKPYRLEYSRAFRKNIIVYI